MEIAPTIVNVRNCGPLPPAPAGRGCCRRDRALIMGDFAYRSRSITRFRSISVASGKYLFTSEAVSMGHPDKLADQISDGVLDAMFAQDPMSRVACETMVTTGLCVIAGEVTTKATVDLQQVVREVVRDVGYTEADMGI